jgi:fimbrial chaperone protein
MKKYMKKMKAAILALGVATLAVGIPARADIAIFPLHPIFTDKVRTQHVNIVNNSTDSALFRMELVYQRQNTDGSYTPLDEPMTPGVDLRKMIVYSPRQISLEGGDVQLVKLALRRPADLPEGEYRAYLKMMRMDGKGPVISSRVGKGISANINIAIGYAVPIIVRHGTYDTTASLSDVKYDPPAGKKSASVKMVIHRKGKFSTLGHINIFWVRSGQEDKLVGMMNGINVFPEIDHRDVNLAINEKSLSGGSLRVVYAGDDADKGLTFDEKVVPVAP